MPPASLQSAAVSQKRSSPPRSSVTTLLYVALAVLVVLHNDLWWWDEPRRVLGLPIALTYHLLYCFVAIGLFALVVRFAWPAHLEGEVDVEGSEP